MPGNPAMISTVRICASPLLSEQTSDRCPCISDLRAPVCEEKQLHKVPKLCSDNKGERL